MILSFKDADTATLASGKWVKRFLSIARVALRKLRQMEIIGGLVCFRWTAAGAEDVEIVDYH